MTEAVTGTSVAEALDLAAAFLGHAGRRGRPVGGSVSATWRAEGVVKYPIPDQVRGALLGRAPGGLRATAQAGATHDH